MGANSDTSDDPKSTTSPPSECPKEICILMCVRINMVPLLGISDKTCVNVSG